MLKTNQVLGGFAALRAARLYRKPLIARCGFLWSEAAEQDHGPSSVRARSVAVRERRLLRGADVVVVTTPRLRDRVVARHGVAPACVRVIPNFVDTERFSPGGDGPTARSLVFVGRLAPEKNLDVLLDAIAGLAGVSLTIAGDGPLRDQLRRQADALGVDARFLGSVPHRRVADVLRSAEAFVLPSRYEGHPKALIEAMACGVPVVGANAPGIREVVDDGVNGLLAEAGPSALRRTLERLLGDRALRDRLGRAARASAEQVSLERIVEMEIDAFHAAVGTR